MSLRAEELSVELRDPLETAVEEDGEEMTKKELGCAKTTSYVLQLQ
jgi:hypothetical protein